MKKALLTLTLVSVAAIGAHAQVAAWDFFGATGSEATSTADIFDAGLDGAPVLGRGAGAAGSAGVNSFRTTGFRNDGISLANTDYFEFSLSPGAGNSMSLSTIDGNFAGTATFSNSPGVSMQYAYSLDGANFTLIGSPFVRIGNGAGSQVDLTGIGDLQNVADSTTVTFRFYASGQTSTGGWGYNSSAAGINGLSVGGTVTSAIPEPATVGLIGMGLGGLVLMRRRFRKG